MQNRILPFTQVLPSVLVLRVLSSTGQEQSVRGRDRGQGFRMKKARRGGKKRGQQEGTKLVSKSSLRSHPLLIASPECGSWTWTPLIPLLVVPWGREDQRAVPRDLADGDANSVGLEEIELDYIEFKCIKKRGQDSLRWDIVIYSIQLCRASWSLLPQKSNQIKLNQIKTNQCKSKRRRPAAGGAYWYQKSGNPLHYLTVHFNMQA